jgi:isopentenyl phosphate kinase
LFFCIIIDARLIPNIAVNQDGSFSTEISTTEDSKFDVTGGINLKLLTNNAMAWDIYRNHITGHLASEPMS